MASRRPSVRTTTEFRLPSPYPEPGAWIGTMARTSADLGAQFTRQWTQWWFEAARGAVDAWWQAASPRR